MPLNTILRRFETQVVTKSALLKNTLKATTKAALKP